MIIDFNCNNNRILWIKVINIIKGKNKEVLKINFRNRVWML